MRWIFFFLLAANIGLYIWHSVESEQLSRREQLNATVQGSNAPLQGRPLVLISELTEEEKTALANRPNNVPEPEVLPVPLSPAPVSPAPVAEVTPPAEIPQVPAPTTVAGGAADTAAVNAWPANQCVLLGPVTDKQYDQIAQRLLARSIVPERRLVDTRGAMEYWVVLPPLDDEKAAVRKLMELQGRGVQGQIIAKGELANAISFGVFAQRAEAEQLATKLHGKGLKVEVKALPQIRQEKWVVLSERQAPKLTDDTWQEIHQDFPRLSKEIKNCQ